MMSHDKISKRRNFYQFHPAIYWIISALCMWLIASVWGFSGGGHSDFALAVVSIFVSIAISISVVLWRISLRWRGRTHGAARRPRFAEWLAGDFEAWPGRQRGSDAAIEALLPLAGVAIGMSIFALVLHFVDSG